MQNNNQNMKTRDQKKRELANLKDKFSKAKITIFTSFAREGEKGLTVGHMRDLKRDLRSVESEYLVEKKTLLGKALAEDKKDIDVFRFPGSIGVVFGYDEEAATAKAVYNFAKKNPALKYFGALWNGRFMNLTEFTEFARLPNREVLIAQFLGMLNYPLSALANVLGEVAKSKN